jgi:hypothetical protein
METKLDKVFMDKVRRERERGGKNNEKKEKKNEMS